MDEFKPPLGMDRSTHLQLIALGDQAKAAHRDALKSFFEFAEALSVLSVECQQEAINSMPLIHQVVTLIEAKETNTQWVIDLIPPEAHLLVESWDMEEEE